MALDQNSVEQQFSQARQTGQSAINFAQSGAGLEEMLRNSVSQRLSSSPLYGQREEAARQVLTSAPRAREDISNIIKGGTILSPTQQQSIMASRQAADVVPLTSLNDLLQAQTGGVETAVGAGLKSFDSILGALQAQAALEQSQAQSAFDRLMAQESLKLEQQKARAASGSGKPSIFDFLGQMLGQMLGQGQVDSPQSGATISGASDPYLGMVSLQGIGDEVPEVGNIGDVIENTDTGYKYEYTAGGWQRVGGQETQQSGFLNRIKSLFGGGGGSW